MNEPIAQRLSLQIILLYTGAVLPIETSHLKQSIQYATLN